MTEVSGLGEELTAYIIRNFNVAANIEFVSKHVHTDRDVVHHDISRLGFFEILLAVNSCSLLYFPIENRHAPLIHGLVESVLQSEESVFRGKRY